MDEIEEIEFEELHANVIIKIYDFSDESVHKPGSENKTEYSGSDILGIRFYDLKVFANGKTDAERNYISVMINYEFAQDFRRGRCIISVIDADEHQRFLKSFSFLSKFLVETESKNSPDKSFDIDFTYISREILLRDPDDLLPNGILTLLIDVDIEERIWFVRKFPKGYFDLYGASFEHDYTHEFLLDSTVGKLLTKESSYFRALLDCQMTEQNTRKIYFNGKESFTFLHIGIILKGEINLMLESVKDIFDMCIVADKYNIPVVTETCRGLLKLCLSNYTVDEFIEIANAYEHSGLKELIINEINVMSQADLEEEIIRKEHKAILKQPIGKCLWLYYHIGNSDMLMFKNIIGSSHISPHGCETFDFYR